MGHGGESTVCSPQNNHSNYHHHPHVGGPTYKKSPSLTKVSSTSGGGSSHNDNSKTSSKVSRKAHAHSVPQPHTKPVSMSKARQSPGALNSHSGNKANLVALPQQAQYHLMKQQSRHSNAVTPRQKSYSPPTLHPMPSGEANSRTQSPVMPGSKYKEHFYAGARFETHPSHIGLPVPPSHWTAPLQRSQSQPSSPVPTSLPQKGTSVDLATLFGNSDSALKSASFPGERLMDALMKMEDERKKKAQAEKDNVSVAGQCIGSLAQAQVTNRFETSDDETDELKKALGLVGFGTPVKAAVKVNNCGFDSRGSDLSPSKYQDISDQLKTLLKVAA